MKPDSDADIAPEIWEPQDVDGRQGSRAGGVVWIVFAAGAWTLFELTGNGPLSAAAFCCNYGCREVLSGFWLLKRDNRRKRGLACCMLYVSYGLWRIVLGGLVMMIVYTMVAAFLNRQAGDVNLALVILVIIAILSIAIPLFCGMILALSTRQAVWIDPLIWESFKRSEFPPEEFSSNRIQALSWAVMAVSYAVSFLAVVYASVFAGGPKEVAIVLSTAILLAGAPAAFILSRRVIETRLAAVDPSFCWPEMLLPESTADRETDLRLDPQFDE